MAGERTGIVGTAAGVWDAVTPLGRAVLATGVVAWIVAWRLGWREAAIVAVASLVAVLVGVCFLLASRSNLTVVSTLVTPRVVAGREATATVSATNDSGRRMLPARMETRVGDRAARLHVPTLAPGASHREDVPIATTHRAVVPVGPVRSVLGDPLGLVRREILWTGTDDLFVHPHTVALAPMSTGWMRDLEGETTNDRSPSDVAFHTLREYVVGDDRRHVHWRTTARQPSGKLMVREFVDTRRAHLAIVLSLSSADYRSADEFELAVSAVGSLGLRAFGDEQEVTCIAGGRTLPSYHRNGFLDALAGLQLSASSPDLGAIVGRARDALGSASVAAVVAGSGTDLGQARLAAGRIGPQVHAMVIRADLSAESTMRRSADVPLVELAALGDLPRMIWAAMSS